MRAVVIALLLIGCTHHAAPKRTAEDHHERSGVQDGYATWYGSNAQQGGPTASGERFDRNAMTAAHRTLPLGTIVRITNKKNGRTVQVRINDRGPYGNKSRIIDVSEAAARKLDMIDAGVVPVRVEVVR